MKSILRIHRLRTTKKKMKYFAIISLFLVSSLSWIFLKHPFAESMHLDKIESKNLQKNINLTNDRYEISINAYNHDEKYSLPEESLIIMKKILSKAQINLQTNRTVMMFSVVNAGMIDFILNMLCSMKLAEIDPKDHVTLALDEESYKAVTDIGMQAILITKKNFSKNAVNNRHIQDFSDIVKMKLVAMHQYLNWGVEPILIDVDIIILEDPRVTFNDEADFEVQCDSQYVYKFPLDNTTEPIWEINLGFYKVKPSQLVLEITEQWISRIFQSSSSLMQPTFKQLFMNQEKRWITDDTFEIETSQHFQSENRTLKIRYLDPILISNAGGVFNEGKDSWKKEANRRRIKRPKLIHFFHIPFIRQKRKLIKSTDLLFTSQNDTCIAQKTDSSINFPIWNQKMKKKTKRR
ncbi:hypothetical protein TRFO_14825 [Tritrichomonas foetus]|uniref:Nucleotide-diphospho-sugar transferase domain-containing protein n=1 Tax=Tritrichomonas foetus TaxID=1144522 RepID=A0A1J4KUA8_9EUKA|nr:hypothetical protein TRFO_14825 [Tritrichomonas foetus]|eukprot:OHT14855.1 hypothetical protein TRFO_14825 [Tritrichomonas foetus]